MCKYNILIYIYISKVAPTISESNMKDTSRPESLDLCYIVKGTANPPPVATWTLDGKEVKPDERIAVSQKGEEFRLEIRKLDLKDAGVWQCKLSNSLGDAKQQAILEVTRKYNLKHPLFRITMCLFFQRKKNYEDQN